MLDSTYCHIRYGNLTLPMKRDLRLTIRSLFHVEVCSLDGTMVSDRIDGFEFHILFSQDHAKNWQIVYVDPCIHGTRHYLERIRRFVGLQYVTIPPVVRSGPLRLWNLEPDHFGINCEPSKPTRPFHSLTLGMVAGHDRKRGQGGCRGRHRDHVPFPDNRSSTRCQLERSTSSGSSYHTASEEDYRTWCFRSLILSLSSLPLVKLTLELDHRR